jgi:hypothetical protein
MIAVAIISDPKAKPCQQIFFRNSMVLKMERILKKKKELPRKLPYTKK